MTWSLHILETPRMQAHSLLLIGFGRNGDGDDYWLLQNSHGENVGDGGIYRVRRGGEQDILFGKMEDGVRTGGLVIYANFPVVAVK